jgi:ABC-type sugar transport system permease subunit
LIVPYTVPALITILIWRGMLYPPTGVVHRLIQGLLGWAPGFFTNEWWAKVAILLVNLWLSYPYFMLICSGSLQSISTDYYDAAQVDGASPWQRFRNITLPLLLVAVGPLLVASFTFNFNNFNLIYIFNAGGPPMSGTPTPAGHTDILISYVYNLAFSASRGVNYGFAAAITIVIFLIVGVITLFQFRYTRMWEEVSENV